MATPKAVTSAPDAVQQGQSLLRRDPIRRMSIRKTVAVNKTKMKGSGEKKGPIKKFTPVRVKRKTADKAVVAVVGVKPDGEKVASNSGMDKAKTKKAVVAAGKVGPARNRSKMKTAPSGGGPPRAANSDGGDSLNPSLDDVDFFKELVPKLKLLPTAKRLAIRTEILKLLATKVSRQAELKVD